MSDTRSVSPESFRKLQELSQDSRRTACFTVMAGPLRGRLIPLTGKAVVVVGREGEVDVAFPDDAVSRRHAEVKCVSENVFLLQDLKSTNGTYCNGERISQRLLEDGDRIMFGSNVLVKFSYPDVLDAAFHEDLRLQLSSAMSVEKEIERARAIQQSQLPAREVFQTAGFRYYGHCEPASQVGGDWWCHFPIDEDKVLLCVLDVCGHGVPSALLVASVKAACDILLGGKPAATLESLVRSLDLVVREASKGALDATFFGALLDRTRLTLRYANAGQVSPLLVSAGEVVEVAGSGDRLGHLREPYVGERALHPGDTLLLFTDGIIESQDAQGREYGRRRLRNSLRDSIGQDVRPLTERLLKDALAFCGDQSPGDDLTLVCCRC